MAVGQEEGFCLHHSFIPAVLSLSASQRSPNYGVFLSPQALAGSGVFETGSEGSQSQGCSGTFQIATTSKEVNLMLKRGGAFKRIRFLSRRRAGLSPLPSPLCISSAALPLSISVRPSLCSFVARFISTCWCAEQRCAPLLYLLQLVLSALIILQGHS